MPIKPPTDQQRKNMSWFIPLSVGVVAFGFILWAWSESPTHRHYNPANTKSAEHTYQDSHAISKLPPSINPKTKTEEEHTEERKESFTASRSDLAAQWAMAHYTFVGLVIGVIGICFIIWTLIETRGAALFAEQTLVATKESSKRQIRAYLSLQVISLNINDCRGVPTIKFKIINKGASPAIKIRYNIKGFGADEYTDWNVSVSPDSSEEIYWPLEGLNMGKSSEPEYFKIKLRYSDIFNGDRWIHCKFYVGNNTFPKTESISRESTSILERAMGAGATTNIIANPSHVSEKRLQFSFYNDDLQKEAEEYAEANKTS